MESVTVDFDRDLNAPVETTRRTVLAALKQIGFQVDESSGGHIQAHRGPRWMTVLSTARLERRPVRLSAEVMRHGSACRLHVHMGDGDLLESAGDVMMAAYQPVFLAVQDNLDSWLLAIDPSMPTPPLSAPEFHAGAPRLGRTWNSVARQIPVIKDSPHLVRREPDLRVAAPGAVALLSADEAQMCLAVATMVTAEEGSLPPAPVQLGDLTVRLRQAIECARPPAGQLSVSAADKKAIDFLYQQASIRADLAVREVWRCRDCGFERIVNPDYRRQIRRDEALRKVIGMGGAALTSRGLHLQLFLTAGRIFNLGVAGDPKYLCSRCEGTAADTTLATICPQCGSVCKESILRVCGHCRYDFLARAAGGTAWAPESEVPVAAVPAVEVAAGAAGTDATVEAASPGWYRDPSGRHQFRWFDGDWSSWAADEGEILDDPLT